MPSPPPPPPSSSSTQPTDSELAAAHSTLYAAGLPVRTAVAGPEHVSRSLAQHSSPFSRPMQELATEAGWGWVWTRPGLERKTRSMLCIAMLCALNRMSELAVHVRGAVRNGCSEDEIREVLLQVAVYVGMPAGLEGTRVVEGVLKELREEDRGES
jgi:4-carboxymuconolactone decarboxylase